MELTNDELVNMEDMELLELIKRLKEEIITRWTDSKIAV